MDMKIEPFPHCCGHYIFTNFPGSGTIGPHNRGSKGEIKEFIESRMRSRGYDGAGYFAVLDQNQRLLYHDLLIGLGFRVVVDAAYSEKHYSLLTTYFKENFPMSEDNKVVKTRDLGGETTVKGRENADKSFFDIHPQARERFFGKPAA